MKFILFIINAQKASYRERKGETKRRLQKFTLILFTKHYFVQNKTRN